MYGTPTIGSSLSWALSFLGQLAFQWVPGTVATIAGTGINPTTTAAPSSSLITSPVTVPQAVEYLQMASAPGVWDNLFYHWSVYVAMSLFVSLILAALIIYCGIRIQQIRYRERKAFAAASQTVTVQDVPKTHLRWNRILSQLEGDDEQGWRLAILEADIMLNELLDTLGYKGETMGDKMKRVERADFRTIDLAWEAHKFRNQIAHQGTGLELGRGDAERTIGLYQRVFREFHFID